MDGPGLADFQQRFWAGDRLDQGLVAYIQSLRPRYQTAIISNFKDDLLALITHTYPMAHAFDLIVGSAYEGIMKPDPRIFQRTLARLGRSPEEAIFIDDFPHNVA
ncbi:HAD-IA family hydrolase, partial [Arthrospira platensis SPKY2]